MYCYVSVNYIFRLIVKILVVVKLNLLVVFCYLFFGLVVFKEIIIWRNEVLV